MEGDVMSRVNRCFISTMLMIGVVLSIYRCIEATEWYVYEDGSGDYLTIQITIAASIDGDTIIVHDGTYVENINFNGKTITVFSEM